MEDIRRVSMDSGDLSLSLSIILSPSRLPARPATLSPAPLSFCSFPLSLTWLLESPWAPGETTARAFRAGVLAKYGSGSRIDLLLEQFLSGDGVALGPDADTELALFRQVFDACDRASKAKETTGFVDARYSHSRVHSCNSTVAFSHSSSHTNNYRVFGTLGLPRHSFTVLCMRSTIRRPCGSSRSARC